MEEVSLKLSQLEKDFERFQQDLGGSKSAEVVHIREPIKLPRNEGLMAARNNSILKKVEERTNQFETDLIQFKDHISDKLEVLEGILYIYIYI